MVHEQVIGDYYKDFSNPKFEFRFYATLSSSLQDEGIVSGNVTNGADAC